MTDGIIILGAGENRPVEAGAGEHTTGRMGLPVVGGSSPAPAGPAPATFARDVSPSGAHEATTPTARHSDRASDCGGGNPPARKFISTQPDDEGGYCYRCEQLVTEPCDGWLCPMRPRQ